MTLWIQVTESRFVQRGPTPSSTWEAKVLQKSGDSRNFCTLTVEMNPPHPLPHSISPIAIEPMGDERWFKGRLTHCPAPSRLPPFGQNFSLHSCVKHSQKKQTCSSRGVPACLTAIKDLFGSCAERWRRPRPRPSTVLNPPSTAREAGSLLLNSHNTKSRHDHWWVVRTGSWTSSFAAYRFSQWPCQVLQQIISWA